MPAGSSTSTLTARFLMPDLIERGIDTVLSAPLWDSGALVAPTSGTVTVYDASGTAVVSAAAVTITGSIATYTVLAATTSGLTLEEGWRTEWTLTVDGVTEVPYNDGALVRKRLYPVVTDDDLYRMESALDPSGSAPLHSLTTFQSKLDEAWAQIQQSLISIGNRVNLINSPYSLRQVHLFKTLQLIFKDLGTRLSQAYLLSAESYRDDYRTAWSERSFMYDEGCYSDSGDTVDSRRRRSANPTLWRGSTGRSTWLR